MNLYMIQIEIYDLVHCDEFDTCSYANVYSSFEKAKQGGLNHLKKRIKEIEETTEEKFSEILEEKVDYSFKIVEIPDLHYAENFSVIYDCYDKFEYNKLEPTHKTYYLDYEGNILNIYYEYRYQNDIEDNKHSILLYPEDLEKNAGNKFKIGDIVKLKNIEEYCIDDNLDRIYVVRWLPRKFNGEKYFENKYALSSFYECDNEWHNKELFTFEYWEKDIEKYEGKIEKNSEYDLLSKIVKEEIKVSPDYFNKIKIGMLPLTLDTLNKENS